MPRIKGRSVPLSLPRRLMCDWLHFSQKVPLVTIERRMDLAAAAAARQAAQPRPSWFAVFIKAYALVAARRPELRRAYLPFPWPRLYEHPVNVAALPVERRLGEEDAVLMTQFRCPEGKALRELDADLRGSKERPVQEVGPYRRALRVGRLPFPLRRLVWWLGLNVSGAWRARYFGTFLATGVASLGASSVHILSPLTSTLAHGVFAPDGTVMVRLVYDHRVMDGTVPARALEELEDVLQGEILAELRDLCGPEAAARPSSLAPVLALPR
jgi:hypothetical protein